MNESKFCPTCRGWGWIASDDLPDCPTCNDCDGTGQLYDYHKKQLRLKSEASFKYWRTWIKLND